MSTYTPDTATVRDGYKAGAEPVIWTGAVRSPYRTQDEMGWEFDRWLAEVKAEAWAEGLKVGWEATSDRVHYNMPTGYRDVPRHLKRTNPYRSKP